MLTGIKPFSEPRMHVVRWSQTYHDATSIVELLTLLTLRSKCTCRSFRLFSSKLLPGT